MLRPIEAQWWREYEYRRAFPGLTHDQYLDEPLEAIQWLTRIHDEVETFKAEQQKAAQQKR